MGAITISRQLGSHGARIARGVAQKLGWPYADKGTINTVIKQYGLIHLDDLYGDKAPTFWDLFNQDSVWTIKWMNKTIQTIAAQGDVVILGRGGFAVLGDFVDVLDVFVKAPEDVRAQRIALRDNTTPEEALSKIASDDKARAKFTKRLYSKDWADEDNHDLVIDTGEVSDEEAIDQIVEAYRALHANLPEGPRVADLEIDPVLSEAIQEQLR
ncbi:MAG TPA: cytidylate kinase-like family protein [Arachnia sp.]|nr:cytidylate kinase-like family protein [Arachnia sp.]HMT85249.1 cytidylate kinase-like family protein [Arachnia sp.]